ncbi:MAG: hypothetical protein QF535_16560 [Anaerolineales bacterium]|jgi:hypothetical protein|nr:hypothetical protein [Anaerolineales bacterium]|tara:strand:- start:64 stop:441 length:378 start_codon:yes stop_codon:yes gene_type:complete
MSFTDLTNAIYSLKPSAGFIFSSEEAGDKIQVTEEVFNKIEWVTGEAENKTAITTTVNPHPELTWSAVNAEMIRLQAEYDAQEYARNRQAEYPSVQELVVALYDTDDKTAVDEKRAAVKLKYPKP